MKEIKQIILEGNEVDKYNKLIEDFNEAVDEGVDERRHVLRTTLYIFTIIIMWIILIVITEIYRV